MESDTRLDSAVFQLTPTRTRYGLVINADGKTEKIASGLLEPFLDHLKEAQDQVARGGYSIMLQPNPPNEARWFTKATIERFVRFVSTPEVLERVNTIESEGLQIEEAIAIQNNDNLSLSTVKDYQKMVKVYGKRSMESTEGNRPSVEVDIEQAVLIYKRVGHQPKFKGSTTQEENSKVQFLKVLESRRSMLQKAQDMAFARAIAAGFDMDHMVHLKSFAECFGALRLMEACLGFMVLWKVKYETGKWHELEETESMSKQPDWSPMNASKNTLIETKVHNEFKEEWRESNEKLGIDSNRKANNAGSGDMGFHKGGDERHPGHQDLYQCQFQHRMFCQWPVHSPPDAPPVFQAYPMQGVPLQQNYSGDRLFFHSPYSQMDDRQSDTTQAIGLKRHSTNSREGNPEDGSCRMGVSDRSQKVFEFEKKCSEDQEQLRKAGLSSKKKSGVVLIRNVNFITSKRRGSTDGGLQSASDSETDKEAKDVQADGAEMNQKNSVKSSKSKGRHSRPIHTRISHDTASLVCGHEEESGNWQAFQNCLLRHNNEEKDSITKGPFAPEKEVVIKRQQNKRGLDLIVSNERDPGVILDRRMNDIHRVSGTESHLLEASNDILRSQVGYRRGFKDFEVDVQFTEIEGRMGHQKATDNDFMINRQNNQTDFVSSNSSPPTGYGFECATNNLDSLHKLTDEPFIVPPRLSSQDQADIYSRTATDICVKFPSEFQKTHHFSSRTRRQLSYEPDDLTLIPMRGTEKRSICYDPAMDYETEVRDVVAVRGQSRESANAVTGFKEGLKSKVMNPHKRQMIPAMKKGEFSKSNPSNEAEVRAERLRSFNTDHQKMKKKREEEEVKRLEALKRERQKRITARSSSGPAQSGLLPQMGPQQLKTKISPLSYKGSKFSDSEPRKWSPLQRLPIRAASLGTKAPQEITKPHRLNSTGHVAVASSPELKKVNGLMKPEPNVLETHVQRLSDPKSNNKPQVSHAKLQSTDSAKPERKIAMDRVRKLSNPKTSNIHNLSSVKFRSTNQVPRLKVSDGPEVKKISAIMNHDRSKAATLLELKTRSLKGPSEGIQNKLLKKESEQKTIGRSLVYLKSNEVQRSNEKISDDAIGEDEVIVKTVVLENEMPLIPVVQVSEERMKTRYGSYNEHKVGDNPELVSEYAVIHSPASPIIRGEVGGGSNKCQSTENPFSHKVMEDCGIEEFPKCSSPDFAAKPDHPPYAQLSYLEEPCASNLECCREPLTNSKMEVKSREMVKAHTSDSADFNSPGKILAPEQSVDKKSSKGFRRLLKFGKKNRNAAVDMCDVESNRLSINSIQTDQHASNTASSNEVRTLKALLFQRETSLTGGTARKVASRPFSLLSPFRSKTEKKLKT